MRLVANWREILRKAWSIRLMLLAGLLTGVETILPFLPQDGMPRGIFAGMSFIVVGAAFVSRLMAQKNIHDA